MLRELLGRDVPRGTSEVSAAVKIAFVADLDSVRWISEKPLR